MLMKARAVAVTEGPLRAMGPSDFPKLATAWPSNGIHTHSARVGASPHVCMCMYINPHVKMHSPDACVLCRDAVNVTRCEV